MEQYIKKSAIVAEIEKLSAYLDSINEQRLIEKILSIIGTLEVKDVDLTDRKVDWAPSKKQMESLKDMLRYNIGVFDYQKFMEVNSLYDDLAKILD